MFPVLYNVRTQDEGIQKLGHKGELWQMMTA